MAKNLNQAKISWYIFFSIAFGLMILMSLAASMKMAQIQLEIRSAAKVTAKQ